MFSNLCWIWSKKTLASSFYKENNLKPCLTKHWCEWGIRFLDSLADVCHFNGNVNINRPLSSVNMTRGGWRYWGRAPKIFRHPKGGLRKFVYFKTNRRVGAPKKLNRLRGGLLKFQASSFNIFIPPCHIKWTFPYNSWPFVNSLDRLWPPSEI